MKLTQELLSIAQAKEGTEDNYGLRHKKNNANVIADKLVIQKENLITQYNQLMAEGKIIAAGRILADFIHEAPEDELLAYNRKGHRAVIGNDGYGKMDEHESIKTPRKGTLAWEIAQDKKPAPEINDERVGNAIIVKFSVIRNGDTVTLTKNGKDVAEFTLQVWKDLVDAVKNKVDGMFGKYHLRHKGDSFSISSGGTEVAQIASDDMDRLIRRTKVMEGKKTLTINYDGKGKEKSYPVDDVLKGKVQSMFELDDLTEAEDADVKPKKIIAKADEFKVEFDEDTENVDLIDGEGTIRVSMPLVIWKQLCRQ